MLTSVTVWITLRITVIFPVLLIVFFAIVTESASSHRKTVYVGGDIMIGALVS